ncbi:hypothetical protein BJ742DRAFT_389669 [Cladochytrium replicatum]|nr:hypothetical protein BJ742DRAFT_389669 [Cladochytrium replicatum]
MARFGLPPAVLGCEVKAFLMEPLFPKVQSVSCDEQRSITGSSAMRNVYVMGRTRRVDSTDVRPERWLEFASPPSDFVYPSFQEGLCLFLGKRLATVEGNLGLVYHVQWQCFSYLRNCIYPIEEVNSEMQIGASRDPAGLHARSCQTGTAWLSSPT